jgi:hypothetical protein
VVYALTRFITWNEPLSFGLDLKHAHGLWDIVLGVVIADVFGEQRRSGGER